MKKTIKILAAVLALAILCLSLAGCRQLDKARDRHGVFTDETKEQIELQGHTYTKFMEKAEISPLANEIFPITDEAVIYVTEKDVPVLLASANMYGQYATSDSQEGESPAVLGLNSKESRVFYGREDLLEKLKAIHSKGELNCLYTLKGRWDYEENRYWKERQLLSDEATLAITKTLARPFDSTIDLNEADGSAMFYHAESRSYHYCDEELLFTNDKEVTLLWTEQDDFFIMAGTGMSYDNEDGGLKWKKVAKEYEPVMMKLFIEAAEESPVF